MDKGEVRIEYCPTSSMLAHDFTKPLQGSLFHKMRRMVMGWDHINTLQSDNPLPMPEERVEKPLYAQIVAGQKQMDKDNSVFSDKRIFT